MNIKRILSAILAGLLLTGSLSACATGDDTPEGTKPSTQTTAPAEEEETELRDNLPDDLDFGGDLTHFFTLCLIGLQLAIYRAAPLPRRDRTVFFTTLAMALIYVAALAVALGAGLGLLWSLVIPLTAPAVYLVVKLILDRVTAKG